MYLGKMTEFLSVIKWHLGCPNSNQLGLRVLKGILTASLMRQHRHQVRQGPWTRAAEMLQHLTHAKSCLVPEQ